MIDESGEKFALGGVAEQRPWQKLYKGFADPAHEDGQTPTYVGRSVPRNDVLYKVRGKARYAPNITMPNMLHGRFVRSTVPSARLVSVDVSAARAVPGVVYILTAAEIDPARLHVGSLVEDTPILAKDVVRHVGEPIAVIAAESKEVAEYAATLVEIAYEETPAVLTPADALAEGAPQLHPQGNTIANLSKQRGDVARALAEADFVIEGTYVNEPIDHCFLEAQSGISFFDEDGVLTLLVSTQYPHFHHKQLERVTGLPHDKIRVIQTVVGGAFGGKIDNTIECVTCLITMATGRPVKMVLDAEEVFSSTTKRHTMTIRHRLGGMKDGRITAIDMDILADGGAYTSYSPIVAGRCVVHTALPYDIPNIKAHICTTFTNNMTAGAMRSFGIVKLAFATESQINKLAEKIGMSPIQIRRINAVKDGTSTLTGQTLSAVGFTKTLDVIEPIYEARKAELDKMTLADGIKRGLGLASLGYGIGYSGVRNPSTARLEVLADGTVIANCGTPDIGPGSDTTLAQIAADAAGISIARIRVVSGDSTKTDDSGPTSASRTTYFSGNAALVAGRDFARQFREMVAEHYALPLDQVRLDDDRIHLSNEVHEFADICAVLGDRLKTLKAYGVFNPDSALDFVTFNGNPYPTYTYATQLAEIEVDTETGKISVPHFWAAHDAGRLVNPMGAEGQIEGGVVMGLGMALYEKIVRNGGYIQNPSFRDYLLAGPKDAPGTIETFFVENLDDSGPYGAKGVAEASLIPVPAAIAAALHDAAGIWLSAMPMDQETVFKALNAQPEPKGKM
ncbi:MULTISPECIES: xanthine dehydrogenase family protein molybdopterin-binding subunit [unclassified Chelatococcus]|jgi:CO/xanthine dehydrogenase Mo-binding subunit|uniref:xanthine dehydrogenase family protein molybdopterin-binding subunit n=1 Tax=unclassified Chelatococcus TaxID=2638111 RepID=UPI001BCCACEC|nr:MULTISPECIES: xanthine dehydrogenase family protein molybdopterin-binding subunit [unclassified Chelatococcus]CAH1653276.1 Ald_Xan_dh_C domain-containing protein [Hyphomicrobiales bacterium]MBS7742923.1 xanthine dehydrogenase family protein [Chelatococcus sp. HY11]MBX3541959.1 xanthine dehydrogenase family protein [Chelatococcus sp.]MCO5074149.1 xanthine dehydrogenase family protein molybdopterin-binding subunit [Chelatococcus sp.]CAH1694330.1 Ald_Xan_dh_C domain-containing protein [Hyphomi